LSQVLADRLNAALGLRIAAVSAMATADLLGELQPGYQTIGILVGAAQNAERRTQNGCRPVALVSSVAIPQK
jgi:hypothetical protein